MIHRIYSSLQTFKSLSLKAGFNVLVADKTEQSTSRQTRNRAGKSSLVEIIHFLTGGDCSEDSIFRAEKLVDHSFGMDIDVAGMRISVERSGASHLNVRLNLLAAPDGALPDALFAEGTEVELKNTKWAEHLGRLVFGLEPPPSRKERAYRPSFRSLFSYFARRVGAFSDPAKHAEQQQRWDQQVAVSFLIDLDWSIAREWQLVRDKEKSLKELKRAAAGGQFSEIVGRAAELRTALALAEDRATRLRESASSYKVLPTYRQHEQEASQITKEIQQLLNESHIDRALVRQLDEALRVETPPAIDDLKRLYDEAGVLISRRALRQFEDVRLFHESVIQNRRTYLRSQLEEASRRVELRETSVRDLDERRSQLMQVLRSHGALDELTAVQQELARKEAEVEVLRKRFEAAEQLEGSAASLDLERGRLRLRLQQDHKERDKHLRRAIVAIEAISGELYERPGRFIIDATPNGPEFSIKIEGDRSKGIGNMEIFAFDMMLLQICAIRRIGPGFVVHDSHLFDGVDSRQKAKAFHLGKRLALEHGYQYLVTINTDDWPDDSEYPESFEASEDVLPVRLTDASEDGGLFGMRFD